MWASKELADFLEYCSFEYYKFCSCMCMNFSDYIQIRFVWTMGTTTTSQRLFDTIVMVLCQVSRVLSLYLFKLHLTDERDNKDGTEKAEEEVDEAELNKMYPLARMLSVTVKK